MTSLLLVANSRFEFDGPAAPYALVFSRPPFSDLSMFAITEFEVAIMGSEATGGAFLLRVSFGVDFLARDLWALFCFTGP